MADKISNLYDGRVQVKFEEQRHFYQVRLVHPAGEPTLYDPAGEGIPSNWQDVPSVTGILKVSDKSAALTQWAANQVVKIIEQQIKPGVAYDEIELMKIIRTARYNFRSVSKEATDIGTLAHDWIEAFLCGTPKDMPHNEKAQNCCTAALKWIQAHKFTATRTERPLYSMKYNYVGTMDAGGLGKIDDRPAIVDWKTSKALYPEYRFQLAAYAKAFEEEFGILPDRWLVRLDKETGDVEPIRLPEEDIDKDFLAFLGLQAAHFRLNELKIPYEAKR